MFEKRTDLALEVHELHGEESGIEIKEENKEGFDVTVATVKSGEGEKRSGKSAGRYITLDSGKLWQADSVTLHKAAEVLSNEIKSLMPKEIGCVLVAGLGNIEITADSLGPKTVNKLLVTRHIEALDIDLYNNAGFGNMAAIATGVLAQTGIESAEIVKSICDAIKPKCVIIIDSLAARRLSRLGVTVQLSDSGIAPGSGVSNKRAALDKGLLGCPVISIGVPMVVDGPTLAYDILEEHMGEYDEGFAQTVKAILSGRDKDMFVTPKDSDVITEVNAKLISSAINQAVHKIGINEINEYLGK